ncbi:MAG: S-methyl-5-thioribose-1-phosphate isomerase [Arenicellales bacterium]|nr:S-methyl-5-thioribose-1-phosphate isomerase [Arenicellales bacterium]
MTKQYDTIRPVKWESDRLMLLDQRLLPEEEVWLEYLGCDEVTNAIRDMVVRGAPAIGVTAAFGVVLAASRAWARSGEHWREEAESELQRLLEARPTAINLKWAVERMRGIISSLGEGDPLPELLDQAKAIHREDIEACHRMGELGAQWLGAKESVLTHCNAGALATGGYGTALGVVRSLAERGSLKTTFADETRPWLQGARLTAWELLEEGIPVTLIPDVAAATLLRNGEVGAVVVGSDRIAANGDVANKIGTYPLALAARAHGVPFMVVAPISTIDPDTAEGVLIPIEERGEEEVIGFGGNTWAASGVKTRNPVFDVTPASLVDVLVTERGVVESPDRVKIAELLAP